MLQVVGRHHRAARVPTPSWMRGTTSQGVSRPNEELDFLPFSTVTLLSTGGLIVAGSSGKMLSRPQRPFRGERVVITAVSGGDDASANVVIDPAIYVGAVQIGSAQGSTPVSAFANTAFGVRLSFSAAGQGTDIVIPVRLLVPTGGDHLDTIVSATVFGRAMR